MAASKARKTSALAAWYVDFQASSRPIGLSSPALRAKASKAGIVSRIRAIGASYRSTSAAPAVAYAGCHPFPGRRKGMAKTLIVQLTCDRCKAEKGENVEGTETVTFGFDGYEYSLDLCEEHSRHFHDTVQGFISWASDRSRTGSGRRARQARPSDEVGGGNGSAPAPRSAADRERLKAIREWARQHGHPDLADRGRIPQAVVAAYEAAHRGSSGAPSDGAG